jgi:hypothetical protein
VNWTWAPPGSKGNVCERCGTNCFCAANEGLLPRTRSTVKNQAMKQSSDGVANENPVVNEGPVVLPEGLAAIIQYDSD